MCKWNPASEIPPLGREIIILEEDNNIPRWGFCYENKNFDDEFVLEGEFHPEKYIWNVFFADKYYETICPEYWLQLPRHGDPEKEAEDYGGHA